MQNSEIRKLAEAAGFSAAMMLPQEIPVDGKYRKFCEDNLCGKYNANYACPPACGSVEALHEKLLAEEMVLVVQSVWEIQGYEDKPAMEKAKRAHNTAILHLMEQLQDMGITGFCAGYNGCPLCDPCKQTEGKPCSFPQKRISCMSAYCIDVGLLAQKCGMSFAWSSDKLHLFGMIAFHNDKTP